MKIKYLLFAVIFLCASMVFSYVDSRELTLSTEGIDLIHFDCGEGYLSIVGVENLDRIEVKVEIYIKSRRSTYAKQFVEDYLHLSLKRKGNKAVLVSHFDNHKFIRMAREKEINLEVKIPRKMDLFVDDNSGSLKISSIEGQLEIDDNSGDMTLLNIYGDVEIDDDSGDIEIDGIMGDLYIDDDSGDIFAENIRGEIDVDDSSGSIDIRNSEGDVTINDDSGDIRLDSIEKDVIIKSDGSGDVHLTNIKGKVYKDD